MKNSNICKLISEKSDNSLQVLQFIFETQLIKGDSQYIADTNRVFLITEGEGSIIVNGREYLLKTGSMVFVMAGMVYTLRNTKQLQFMYIDYLGSRAESLLMRFRIAENNFVFHGMSWLIPVWKESLVKASEKNIDLLSESMLLYAFSQLNTESSATDESTILTDYINEHYQNSSLTLSTVAKELGYNAKYLSHMFMKKMGVGFTDYLKELRLRQAVLLINQGITSVKNISILCGFSDPLYFSKVFKQKFGVSPKEFIIKQNENVKGENTTI